MGVSLKTEQRRSHTAVACSGPWVRRAEGCGETRQVKSSGQVPVNPRRPPSLPLVCELFPDPSSFSVLRETPMASSCDNFKQLKCYGNSGIANSQMPEFQNSSIRQFRNSRIPQFMTFGFWRCLFTRCALLGRRDPLDPLHHVFETDLPVRVLIYNIYP
jgi:hypothetical protein